MTLNLIFREFSQALVRLTKMIRGIGDPLVAAYARCYICRVSMFINNTGVYIIATTEHLRLTFGVTLVKL